jgi:hypothetical protein
MFLRVTGRYQEILESYRDPVTGKPSNRCVYRWPRERSLDDEWKARILAWNAQMLRTARQPNQKNRYRLHKLTLRTLVYSRARRGLENLPPDESANEEERRLRLELASCSPKATRPVAHEPASPEPVQRDAVAAMTRPEPAVISPNESAVHEGPAEEWYSTVVGDRVVRRRLVVAGSQ